MEKKRYISYSIWGTQPIYLAGILKNIERAKDIYPGWKMIVYYDNSVPEDCIQKINSSGVQAINATSSIHGSFWRFYAADLPDCEYVIFRDADSRLSKREMLAVNEWIASGKTLHIMRDHPAHEIPFGATHTAVMAGMWGIKGRVVPMEKMIKEFSEPEKQEYGIDQKFLEKIDDMFKGDALVHDEFFGGLPFPGKRENFSFIGERIDEHDQPSGNDRLALEKYYLERDPYKKMTRRLASSFRVVARLLKKIFKKA